MAQHYSIKINVSYDDISLSENTDLANDLYENIQRCIARHGLLNDSNEEAIVEDYNYFVEIL